jgi:Tfp pilus assembly protein PilO
MDISELTLKTEADHTNRVPMDARLRTLLSRYALSAILAMVLVSGAIITESYITSLGDTLNKFQTLKINSVKMKDASRKEGETIASVRSIFRSYAKGEATEGTILTAIDSVKSHMKNADIMVDNFERKGNETTLPVTLTGMVHDYTAFINDIGYLQSLISPFFNINSVSIANPSDQKGALANFEIKGTLRMQSVNMDSIP